MADDRSPAGVGRTAVGMAWLRATESARHDRLFEDPWAQAFVDADPDVFARRGDRPRRTEDMDEVGARFYHRAAIRTRFFDDYLLAAARHGCGQVVLTAA